MKQRPKNIAKSNRARLLNLSRERGTAFQELVQYFALSRFLYRLSVSDVASCFVLKGAMLLHAMNIDQARSTLDIDLIGKTSNAPESIRNTIEKIIQVDVEEDGLEFEFDSIRISDITRDADYVGRRVQFQGRLDSIRIPMQIDIGFGDAIIPEPVSIQTPVLLDYPSGTMKGYALETSIAEKTQILFHLELLNSRMKDFYDIWMISRNVAINPEDLVNALINTCRNRGTILSPDSIVFTNEFLLNADKQTQWAAFCRKRSIESTPGQFSDVAREVLEFLRPAIELANAFLNREADR